MTEESTGRSTRRPERPQSQKQSRWAAARAVLFSWDLLLGAVVGIGLAALPTFSAAVEDEFGTALFAASGVAAAIAALVLTAMTVLLATYNDAYKAMLRQVPGGVKGTLEPYRVVVVVASLASLVSFAVALAQPVLVCGATGWRWAAAALPLTLLAWAVLGCIQTVNQLIDHVTNNEKAGGLAARLATAQRARSEQGS